MAALLPSLSSLAAGCGDDPAPGGGDASAAGGRAGGSDGSRTAGGGGGGAGGASDAAGDAPGWLDGNRPETPTEAGAADGPVVDSGPAGLGPWTGNDNVAPSQRPPGGLPPEQVPMFVSLGFDDNPDPEPMAWIMGQLASLKNPAGRGQAATYDGTTPKATFYNTSVFAGAGGSWKTAHAAGFETGNHTVNHHHGAGGEGGMNFNEAGWRMEIEGCTDYLTSPAVGATRDQIVGFRTPYGQYNAALFPVLKSLGFWYDCSIDEGQQGDQDGTNYFWPYTLDGGSPGHAAHTGLMPIRDWPKGLWEMPIYMAIIPPDSEAQKYGVAPGLRTKLGYSAGKITGMDWNFWFSAKMTGAEFVATLKYTLDQRLKGNRAPLLIGMHSAIYAAAGNGRPINATPAEARAAVVEFLQYALGFPDVRIVPTRAVLDWIRNPVPLH